MAGRLLILLDRDGVVNAESDAFVKDVSEFNPLAGSLEAIARLSRAGHAIAVVSNQSGVGRGFIDPSDLEQIHRVLRGGVEREGGRIDRIEVCPHLPGDDCACRKPRPGLLESAARALGHAPSTCVLIGDRATDLAAAGRFGCPAFLVRTGHGRATEDALDPRDETPVFDDLAAAASRILTRN
ncbi:MAG: D-glycero-beta-D-manno-heptose 1,7-bisphosphate 7-phosphatase [bacterium]|nr:D-glycero-beta-D-manno-heptose 1,7-bisphosphate 7-phosphatase [bacterium]